MARPLRIEFHGAWYHVLHRGANRQAIFLDDADRLHFLKILGECRKMWSLELLAYCLMPNHYHLLIRTPQGNLSRIMRHVNGVYTQYFNREYARDGSLLRGRYKSILLDGDSYLLQVTRYIHLNPVKAKLAALPEEYRWSSYKFYLGAPGRPTALLTQPILDLFGSSKERVQEFKLHTQSGIDDETDRFYSHKKLKPILGKPEFLANIRRKASPLEKPAAEIPESKTLFQQPSLESIFRVVEQFYELSRSDIKRSRRGRANEGRDCLAYLARTMNGYPLHVIAEVLGGVSYVAINHAVRRMEERQRENSATQQRLQDMQKALYEINAAQSENDKNVLQLKT
ncbi:MAG: transposase [Elusimicrobia bacterium]|nr:transposase [Elusimicrobiota bacterium]